MSFAESKIERERDRALASLAFVEREQERVLHGLHQVGETENIALIMFLEVAGSGVKKV